MRKLLTLGVTAILFSVLTPNIKISSATEHKNELYITDSLVVDLNTTEALYNTEDELIGYYIEGDNGYAIIGVDGELVEFSDNSVIDKFDKDDDKKSYYAGAGTYFIETDSEDEIEEVYFGEVAEKEEVNTVEIEPKETFKSKKEFKNINTQGKMSATITYPKGIKDGYGRSTYTTTRYNSLTLEDYGSISHRTRCFSYNNNGTCGSTASAILMYYYYDHLDKSYVKNNSYKGKDEDSQEAFVEHFKKLIDDGKGDTDYPKLKKGINKYLAEIGKSKNCKYAKDSGLAQVIFNSVYERIKKVINSKKPCIVGLKNEPKYGNHWVVCGGYAEYWGTNKIFTEPVIFIKINNGWYFTREESVVYVNYNYVDGVIYLK